MRPPTLCMIFEAIGPYNAIGKVAADGIKIALEAGWHVTAVAQKLDETLRSEVDWLPLYVPPRLFFAKWITARHFIQRALGGRAFDVVHAHQPQAATLSDVFQCHYLTRAAYQRRCLTAVETPGSAAIRLQEQGVLYAEDRCYRRWNPETTMLYNSRLTRDDFHRIYGPTPQEAVLPLVFPELHLPTAEERRQARRDLIGEEVQGVVVGYLGGLHERKGYRRLIKGMEESDQLFLLMGGQYSEGYVIPSLQGRYRSVGLVRDVDRFYAACDVLVVPSHYEPLGLVAFEAASRGVPVIATQEVGALPHLLEHGAGLAWNPQAPLMPLACQAVSERADLQQGAWRMSVILGRKPYRERLLSVYRSVKDAKEGCH